MMEPKGCPTPGACSCIAPPPEDTADLIAETDRALREAHQDILRRNRDALRSLALEIERLKERDSTWEWTVGTKDKQILNQADRIHELEERRDAYRNAGFNAQMMGSEMAERIRELEVAAKAPPPEEVASAMAGLAVIRDSTIRPELRDYARAAEAILRSLALENERLIEGWSAQSARAEKAESRIGELEAECASLQIAENHHHEEFARVEAERDDYKAAADTEVARYLELLKKCAAIRAKTIEECAQLAENMTGRIRSPITAEVASAIRALAQSEKDEEK